VVDPERSRLAVHRLIPCVVHYVRHNGLVSVRDSHKGLVNVDMCLIGCGLVADDFDCRRWSDCTRERILLPIFSMFSNIIGRLEA
jgi:hypothetical protein